MKLYEIAHCRSGDKGDICNISVIAYRSSDYALLREYLTADQVKSFFKNVVKGDVIRYELPGLFSLNFVLYGALGGGVTRSLRLDQHGKCLCSYLAEIEIG